MAAGLGHAQSAFEVASIKQNTSGDRWESVSPISAGRFTARNVTVGWLVRNAYRVEPFQIAGLPGWANSERYDISAKAAADTATPDEIRMMLRALLADRFEVVLRHEVRDLPAYALVATKNGPKLAKAKSETCTGKGDLSNPCGGFRIYQRRQMWGNTVTLKQFAGELTYMMERTVVDKTGITGLFDIRVEWTPEHFGPEPGTEVKPDEANATLFTAIQEQLGLKLVSEKAPVEMLIVERVSRPGAN
jgi:uncharacterized protein (TIGR03435 family)